MNVYAKGKNAEISLNRISRINDIFPMTLVVNVKYLDKNVWINVFQGFKFNKYMGAYVMNALTGQAERIGEIKFTTGLIKGNTIISNYVLCDY